ncbi:hypothetical protein [Mycobacterium aquaticum]|uniref:Uncharacterized protein n=1 Tax=Mycobacterium aquaticum TaxID=1927124 RepID=A0A1X0A5A4_9MYCO|nr:hypothetical protein [Mycobacterium aquaticum]ORA25194.1 hypothetical protein BST13_33275 [Mycobacterium aquaticum]
MSDPAVEAAQRAWEEYEAQGGVWKPEALRLAAREALKPIRELHQRVDDGHPSGLPTCEHCQGDWPCSTSALIYTTEELEDR